MNENVYRIFHTAVVFACATSANGDEQLSAHSGAKFGQSVKSSASWQANECNLGRPGRPTEQGQASLPLSRNTITCVNNLINKKKKKLTFSSSLALSLRSKKLLSLTGSNLVVLDLPVAQAADLLEKL